MQAAAKNYEIIHTGTRYWTP